MLIHNANITGSLTFNGVDISDITGSESSIASLNQATASLSSSISILSGSFLTTSASYSSASGSFSQRITIIEGKYATTGSNSFNGSQTVTGSLTVSNQIVAQTLSVQQVTSSIVFSSGSNVLGNNLSNTQQLTGSVNITGSLSVNGVSTSGTVSGTTNYVPKFTGASTIGNSIIYESGAGIGIGTTSAAYLLQVGATTDAANVINIVSSTTGTSNLFFSDTNNGQGRLTYNHTSDFLSIFTNDSERLRITSSGNIGIGTTSPENAAGYATITINGSSGGQITFATSNSKKGYLYNNATNMYIGSESGALIFDAGAIEAMRITSGGNVGIGTTSPASRLEIYNGSGDTRITVTSTGATGASDVRLINSSGTVSYDWLIQGLGSDGRFRIFDNAGASTGERFSIDQSGAATFSSSVTATSFIKSGGTSSQYLMADGSTSTLTNPVTGTGTTNYLPKFTGSTTIGNSSIQDGTSSVTYTYSTNPIFNVTDGTNTTRLGVATTAGAYVDIAKANDGFIRVKNGLAIGTSDGFYGTYFDVNGNLGLGTNNPVVKLELIGNYRQKALVGNSNGFNISINSSTDVVSLINYYNAGLVFGVNNAEGMRLTSTGLGIGTTTFATDSKLAVQTSGGKFDVRGIGVASIVLESNGGMHYNAPTGNFHKFQINNSTLMELNGSGNLGLGVTPSAGGLGGYTLFEMSNGGTSIYSGANQSLIGTNASWSGGTASYKISNFATLYNQQSGQHQWYIAPSGTAGNAISFTQAMTLDASGNLAIGTTSTGALISGTEKVLRVAGSNLASLYLESIGNRIWGNYVNSAGTLTWYDITGAATRMVINSTGNVGIGTTSPIYLLDVSGTDNTVYSSTAIAPTLQVINNESATTGSASILQFRGANSNLWNFGLVTDATTYSGSLIVQQRTGAGTYAERMRITSGGNVGIGTSSPDSILQLGSKGTSTQPFITLARVATGGYWAGIDWYDGSTNTIKVYSDANNGLNINVKVASDLQFSTNNTEKMRITSGGNVGIGTTSPAYKLDITALGYGIQHYGNSTNSLRTYAGSAYQIIETTNSGVSSAFGYVSGNFYVETAATERMRITSGGSVLINTTSQAGYGGTVPKLEVVQTSISNTDGDGGTLSLYGNSSAAQDTGAALVLGQAYSGTTTATGARVRSGKENGTSGNFASYLALDTRPNGGAMTERLRITSGGNVGIGTTNPTEKLHVNGNIKTAAPTGYTAGSWKLGTAESGTVTTNRYITIEIDGQIYTINALLGTP